MERTFISSTKVQYGTSRSLIADRNSRRAVYLSTYLSRLARSVLKEVKSLLGWWVNLVLSLF